MTESTTSPTSGYRPGVCNIDARERRRRYAASVVCAVAAVAYLGSVLAVRTFPAALLLGLFVPVSLGVEFLLQGRRAFCVSLGLRGRVGPDLGGTDDHLGEGRRVTDAGARTTDRRYALRLTLLGVVTGGVVTAVVYGLVLFLG